MTLVLQNLVEGALLDGSFLTLPMTITGSFPFWRPRAGVAQKEALPCHTNIYPRFRRRSGGLTGGHNDDLGFKAVS